MINKSPKGVEIVSSCLIVNNKDEILLTQSPKWSNKWTLPGGHVESGETILEAAEREAEEETGLELKPIKTLVFGELIGSKDFHRPAHFIYFDCIFKVIGGKLKLDNKELTAYKWLKPKDALKLDLAESFDETIKEYIKYLKNSVLPQSQHPSR